MIFPTLASLENKNRLFELFKDEKFDIVINLAAQAGVRYSITNPDVYMEYLKPCMSGCRYVSMEVGRNSMEVYLGKLYDSGKQIGLGSYYDVVVEAADCPEAGIHDMRVYVINPFNGQTEHGLERIDDYTLFMQGGVPSAVKSYFADENDDWTDISYCIPPVDADEADSIPSLTAIS